jgi:hypothetical protein
LMHTIIHENEYVELICKNKDVLVLVYCTEHIFFISLKCETSSSE